MWWHSSFKIAYSGVAFSCALLSGSYYFVQLRGVCGPTALPECISHGVVPTRESAVDKPKATTKPGGPDKARTTPEGREQTAKPDRRESATRPPGQGSMWSQTSADEEMLIWTGHLDGEVGRIALSDFERSVRSFQATSGAGIASDEQHAALQKRVSSIRSSWRFERESDPLAAELWLPRKLLPSKQDLSHGSRYQSLARDFIVDVAEWDADSRTIETIKQIHCCGISPARKLEGPIVDTPDAGGLGFILSARDGQQRVSVRAQQRDGVIRILAIAYDMERDKEFRVLRNAIASSYVAFAPARKRDDRLTSCSKRDGERCPDRPAADPKQWDRQGPL